MNQSLAVWTVIVLSLITANLPFVLQRRFLVLPWTQAGESRRPAWLQWLVSLVFFGLLLGLAYLAYLTIGRAYFMASDLASVALFVGKLVLTVGLVALLLALPGRRNQEQSGQKSFLARMLELLVFYGLVGALGFAFEINMGNLFTQTWEFYAITLSLFLVLGYPGFVYRYLLRRPKPKRQPA
ncbi:DUF2818 family protein [Pusillimonas sp. MFBS29]|nr:DUF2818 family protein [Pusillimonas sp. MFBS29]MCC2595095.1 DUF2818 family protein [Pusillimonas sp. MFBS29]